MKNDRDLILTISETIPVEGRGILICGKFTYPAYIHRANFTGHQLRIQTPKGAEFIVQIGDVDMSLRLTSPPKPNPEGSIQIITDIDPSQIPPGSEAFLIASGIPENGNQKEGRIEEKLTQATSPIKGIPLNKARIKVKL